MLIHLILKLLLMHFLLLLSINFFNNSIFLFINFHTFFFTIPFFPPNALFHTTSSLFTVISTSSFHHSLLAFLLSPNSLTLLTTTSSTLSYICLTPLNLSNFIILFSKAPANSCYVLLFSLSLNLKLCSNCWLLQLY